ncbi:hypothetical protein VIS19158_08900, partial [Vibrio scophthalmi LMG 19158]
QAALFTDLSFFSIFIKKGSKCYLNNGVANEA